MYNASIHGKEAAGSEATSPVNIESRVNLSGSQVTTQVPDKQIRDNKELTPAYRDFMIFEERLKYSLKLLTFRQRQHFAMLITLFVIIAYFVWLVFFSSLEQSIWNSISKVMLFILCAVFLLILNSEDIYLPRRFIPNINRVLSQYGLQFGSQSRNLEAMASPSFSTGTSSKDVDVEYRKYFQTGLARFRTSFQKKAAAASHSAANRQKN